MSSELLSIVVLAALFGLAMVPRAHLGLAAFAASFLVAEYAGVSADELVSFFPSDFFVLIVGVMMLFAVVQLTGAMQWIVDGALAVVGGRTALVPLVPLAIGGVLGGIGTLPGAVVAIVAPIAMSLSRRFSISPFLMGYATLVGATLGMFSPIAVFGLATDASLDKAGVTLPDGGRTTLGVAFLVLGLVLSVVMMVTLRLLGRGTVESSALPAEPITPSGTSPITPSGTTGGDLPRIASLVALVVLVVCAAAFDLNVGYLGFVLAFALLMLLRLEPDEIIRRVPWGVLVLIGGLLTYIGLMTKVGAFVKLSDWLTFGSSPMLALLAVCYVAAVTSFFANSLAVIVATLPLVPGLTDQGVGALGAVVAITLSAVVVDVNPLGPAGGLVLGSTSAEHRTTLFRQLLVYGVAATLVAPVVLTFTVGWL